MSSFLETFKFGAIPGPCASSGGRLPEALFMVFQLDSKDAEIRKSSRIRKTLHNDMLLARFGFEIVGSEPSKVRCNSFPPYKYNGSSFFV